MPLEKDVIFFKYEMMDSKGNLLDSSGGKPMAIVKGKNQVFNRVENVISSLSVGEIKRVAVNGDERYGVNIVVDEARDRNCQYHSERNRRR